MHIFTPDPEPTPAPPPVIYAADELLSRETWKAADLVTAGRIPSSPLLFEPGRHDGWESWVLAVFGPNIAPSLLLARDAASQGVVELSEQDRKFGQFLTPERRLASTAFGLLLLEASQGARHMPEVSKLLRMVTAGHTPGHAITVLALRSVLFGIATVNCLVASLFCEWAGAQGFAPSTCPDRERLQSGFATATPSLSRQVALWLQTAGNNAFQSRTES